VNSRDKGARGELEWAKELKDRGYEARRGQQFSGGGESPDVIHSIPGVHFEVKRTERLALYAAVDQARRDAAVGCTPVVVHRCNDDKRKTSCKGDWLVVLGADDFFELLREADHGPRIL
jgi:hypothetical protein